MKMKPGAGVGAQLHHAERRHGPGKGVPVRVGADKLVDVGKQAKEERGQQVHRGASVSAKIAF